MGLKRHVFDQGDVGLHIDGTYGTDHALRTMRDMLTDVTDELKIGNVANAARDLLIELDEEYPKGASDWEFADEWLDDATKVLEDATADGFFWQWDGGDLVLFDEEEGEGD